MRSVCKSPIFPQKDKNIELDADSPLKLLLQTEKREW